MQNNSESQAREKAILDRYNQAEILFLQCLAMYNEDSCQCAYRRYRQLIGVDCTKSGNSFKCQDTEYLMALSKPYFDIEKSELTDECTNEKWVCKKCGSAYEYGWSDFSIAVDRQKLELTNLTVTPKGKPALKPLPLFLGLMGHSFPSRDEIKPADFTEFENYMLEKQ